MACCKCGCKCCSSYTLPAYLWAALSSLSAVLCPIGLYFSNWLQRKTPENTYNCLSSFRLCLNETSLIQISCDAYFSFNEIYSPEWKAITLMMGLGACCLVFAGVMSLFGFCVRKLFNRYVTILVAILQCFGGEDLLTHEYMAIIIIITLYPTTLYVACSYTLYVGND